MFFITLIENVFTYSHSFFKINRTYLCEFLNMQVYLKTFTEPSMTSAKWNVNCWNNYYAYGFNQLKL